MNTNMQREGKPLYPALTHRTLVHLGHVVTTEVNMCKSPVSNRSLKADFFLSDIGTYVEFDGPQHFKSYIYGDARHFDLSLRKDYAKAMSTIESNMRLIRVTASQTTSELNEFIKTLESDDSLLGIYCTETSVHEIRNEQDIRRFYRMVAGYDVVGRIDGDDEIVQLKSRIHELNSLLSDAIDIVSELQVSSNIKSRHCEVNNEDALMRNGSVSTMSHTARRAAALTREARLRRLMIEFYNHLKELGMFKRQWFSPALSYSAFVVWLHTHYPRNLDLIPTKRAFIGVLKDVMRQDNIIGNDVTTRLQRPRSFPLSKCNHHVMKTLNDDAYLRTVQSIDEVVEENKAMTYLLINDYAHEETVILNALDHNDNEMIVRYAESHPELVIDCMIETLHNVKSPNRAYLLGKVSTVETSDDWLYRLSQMTSDEIKQFVSETFGE